MNIAKHPDLLEQLAASYALGTMRGRARSRFETMARQSPTVRASTLIWQERFSSLTELQPEQVPSANVWKRIENLIAAEPGRVAESGMTSAIAEKLKRLMSVWRGVALGSGATAIAAVLVAVTTHKQVESQDMQLAAAQQQNVALTERLQSTPQIQYVSVLSDDKQAATMLATFDPTKRTITLKRVGNYQESADKSLQLWALPETGGPKSLGVLGSDAVVRLTATPNDVQQVPTLAITLEPHGGVPPGSGPTGPVLFKGPLLRTTL